MTSGKELKTEEIKAAARHCKLDDREKSLRRRLKAAIGLKEPSGIPSLFCTPLSLKVT